MVTITKEIEALREARWREVLALRESGLTFREIAARMGLSGKEHAWSLWDYARRKVN